MDVLKDTYNVLYVDDEENNLNAFKAALMKLLRRDSEKWIDNKFLTYR